MLVGCLMQLCCGSMYAGMAVKAQASAGCWCGQSMLCCDEAVQNDAGCHGSGNCCLLLGSSPLEVRLHVTRQRGAELAAKAPAGVADVAGSAGPPGGRSCWL